MLIDSPTAYSKEAARLISKLGIDPIAFENKYSLHDLYRSLISALLFSSTNKPLAKNA